jgi:hypothetical protein
MERKGRMASRRSRRTPGFGRSATVVLALLVVACTTARPMSDPGRLEVWNSLREPLAVIVGGRMYQLPACQVSMFEEVELRGVRLATSAGLLLAEFDADRAPTPIGKARYIVIGQASFRRDNLPIADLRSQPGVERPNGRGCTATVGDLLDNVPRGGEPREP